MRRPAYARAFLDRVAAGERFSLVVIAVSDWSAGKMLTDRPHVARLVVPADADIAALDLSFLFGFDVLVMGGEDAPFYGVSRLALAFGAASVWAEFDDGVWRLENWATHPGVVAMESVKDADALLRRLPALRDIGLLTGQGAYKAPMFREARLAFFGSIFGPTVEARLREKVAA